MKKKLKNKIEKSDKKTTSLKTYSEHEEDIKKIREELGEKLKGKKEDREKLEKELKDLDDSLKKKKEDRKKALQEAKQKFEEFKRQIESVAENTDKVKNQGKIGREALLEARKLGVNGSYSTNDGTNTYNFVKKVIDDALKKIDEELKKLEDKKE
ncbi:hypothetical protein [Borreliella garinii]|uniref:hypothetical protein n=1 Tax=Borreliella garinii TaxID=29519 RepID=UPI00399CB13B